MPEVYQNIPTDSTVSVEQLRKQYFGKKNQKLEICAVTMIALGLSTLLLVARVTAVQVDYFDFGAAMVQKQNPTGEYLFDYGDSELFYVDLDNKRIVYTLPGLEKYVSFEAQFGLQEISTLKHNLGNLMKRTNNTPAVSIEPRVTVYTEHPVVLGEPNVAICAAKNIFPPVMNITWLKNGEKIDQGVTETLFLPSQDHSFRKFLYLAFIPTMNDFYACEVEHWGLTIPRNVPLDLEVPPLSSETYETLICALGLFVGFIGVIAGAVLILKGMRLNAQQRRRGN